MLIEIENETETKSNAKVSESKKETSTDVSFGSCLQNRNCYLTINGVEIFDHQIHVLRAPTTDLSMTIALAILAVISINFAGLKALRFDYIKKFVNFKNPIQGFVGLLEMLSEFIKIISFSFRLFGNIFAGELLLIIITTLTYGLATLPFMFLEIFIGFIQAFVFFILITMFMSLAVTPHSSEH
jgi:F-type H+-transporting ATPase subunit a